MKKSLILAGMLVVGYANAQETNGKVGVNTETPKATLEVQPTATNLAGTTNEGIIAPKLSKERIAAIATPVEGTLVYATDATYTGSDSKVAKITEKGYYFYNGTEWVKSGVGANDQLWAQATENGEEHFYLKASKGTNDLFGYIDRGVGNGKSYVKILGEPNLPTENNMNKYRQMTPNYELITSKALPLSNKVNAVSFYDFNHRLSIVEPDHVNNTTSTTIKYNGGYNSLRILESIGKTIEYMNGQTFNTGIGDAETPYSINVNNAVGLQGVTDLYTTGNVGSAVGLIAATNNYNEGNITSLVGARVGALNTKGSVRNMDALIVTNYLNGGNVSNNQRGIDLLLTSAKDTSINSVKGITNRYVHRGIITGEYIGVYNSFEPQAIDTTVGNFYGYRLNIAPPDLGTNKLATNAYGLHIDDINFASGDNYSIYTKAGAVRFGDLAGTGNREVYVDANGVLKAKTTTMASNTTLWVEDTTTNSIKLAVNSDGNTRTNAVSITDGGMVLGSSFRGTNGATIFPDYVFQKYYTGNSSIKADYTFKTLSQVEDFVKTNGHLPGYKSAEAIKAQGYVDLMETQLTNVEKIEELYLHSIEQEKVNKTQAEELKAKDAKIQELEARLEKLEKLLK